MLTFCHAPWSRSSAVFWLLEEFGVEYRIEQVDIRAGAPESYRAIQPSKKVPAINDADRAAYLTWLVYCDAVLDPCIAAKAQGWTYESSNSLSFGLFDDMVRNVEKHLTRNRYAAGNRFTAADTQLAAGIQFTMITWRACRNARRSSVIRNAIKP